MLDVLSDGRTKSTLPCSRRPSRPSFVDRLEFEICAKRGTGTLRSIDLAVFYWRLFALVSAGAARRFSPRLLTTIGPVAIRATSLKRPGTIGLLGLRVCGRRVHCQQQNRDGSLHERFSSVIGHRSIRPASSVTLLRYKYPSRLGCAGTNAALPARTTRTPIHLAWSPSPGVKRV